jgi:hypothetical protein
MREGLKYAAGLGLSVVLGGCFGAQAASPAGTTTLTSGMADPCRGAAFDADALDARCTLHGAGAAAPVPEGLRLTLAGPTTATSGADVGVVVEMTNTTTAPLPVDVEEGCGTFEGQASNDKASSFETDCFGVCEKAPEARVVHVTLEPGGVVRKRVKFSAVQTKTAPDARGECTTSATGALPPGDYDLRVTLPWIDPVEGRPDVSRPRVLEEKISVTP